MEKETGLKRRGTYHRFTAEQRATIGRYFCENGVAATSRYFTKKLERNINESIVRSIKTAYQKELSRKRKAEQDVAIIDALRTAKRGRHLLIADKLDMQVQSYLKKLRECRGSVSNRIAIAAAKGITCTKAMLAEFGG